MNIVHFKEHKVVEKEESSSYLSRFWCLDNVAHHINAKVSGDCKEGREDFLESVAEYE